MPGFGAVMCPKCKRFRAVNLASKSTKCPYCGRSAQTKGLRVFARTDTESGIAEVVGKLSAIKGESRSGAGTQIQVPLDVAPSEDVPRSRREVCLAVVRELGEGGRTFSMEEASTRLAQRGIDEAEKYLNWLKESSVIYEPRSGVYRLI